METYLYKINKRFAKANKLPLYFVAVQVAETNKAVRLYGTGTLETTKLGICCACGRALTHPVSVELGIGPECGGHWHDWSHVGGYTMENIERLKGTMKDIIIDTWMPKACVLSKTISSETVTMPNTNPAPVQVNTAQSTNTNSTPAMTPATPATPATPQMKSNKSASLVDGLIKIKFAYDFNEVTRVKTLTNRRFVVAATEKYWTCPILQENLNQLVEWNYTFCPKLQAMLKPVVKKVADAPIPTNGFDNMKKVLFQYQKEGVASIQAKNGRVLLADEMGLGKTAQALAWLELNPTKVPVVIVVPASLKLN